ncbi:MAG: ABC transporter ATP-binding protein [Succiniclasticum sp.]|jgi:branched-chain amino acid transport system ATP-binding protein
MLSLRNISACYGKFPALSSIDIEVPTGSITCLLGSNGAGKTTTIKTVLGILKPTQGEIYLEDEKINGLSTEAIIRKGIGVCPEGRRVFPKMTVEDNLLVGARCNPDGASVKENIEKAYTLFPRLAERRWQNAGTMSGGEQQMLAISRALMSNPRLILMDEPSLGLAPIVVNEIFSTIRKIHQEGVTILLVEQNGFKALEMADNAYILQKGRIIASCTEKEQGSKEKLKEFYLAMTH